MGTIISTKKDPSRATRIEQKTAAVGAFAKSKPEQTFQIQKGPVTHEQKPTSATSPHQSDSRGGSQAIIAVVSWGEGVVGTGTHLLHKTGTVSSRGVEGEVASSKTLYPNLKPKVAASGRQTNNNQLYTGFATVTPLPNKPSPSPSEAALKIQSMYRGYRTRKSLDQEKMAAINIQRYIRGYQSRQELQKQDHSARMIQRNYRKFMKLKTESLGETRKGVDKKSDDDSDNDEEEDDDEEEDAGEAKKGVKYSRPWRESTVAAPVLDNNVKIGKKTKESFDLYQGDINDLKWKTEQQIEATTMGSDYIPPRIVLIASNVPRSDVLQKLVRDDVLKIYYDFAQVTLDELAEQVAQTLQSRGSHSKARSVAMACQGAPGYFNPVKGKIVTSFLVKQDEEISRFWRTLGTYMTKLNPEDTKIHLIGNNVAGNKQGVKLLKFLKKACKPSIVKFECPLEVSQAGVEMLTSYFDYEKYKIWKTRMHSKVSFKL